jgi:Tfp pilus assembly protein PilF
MQTQRQIGGSRHLNTCQAQGRGVLLVAVLGALSTLGGLSNAQNPGAPRDAQKIHLYQIEGGAVSVLKSGATGWLATQVEQDLDPGDRVQTGLHTRAALLWSDQSVVPIDELTELEILPPRDLKDQFGLNLIRGIISFFHRSNEPSRIRIITRAALAGVVGTEFVLEVNTNGPTERTILSVVDGTVQFYNNLGSQVLTNNQESFAELGSAPSPPVGFIANNRLQWCFYYPGVLDLRDVPLSPAEETALADSLRAYRLGDLLAALRLYPAGRQPGSDAERIYHAAVLLSVGRVSQTENILATLQQVSAEDRIQRLATALRVLIAAVKRQANPSGRTPQLTTELMAASYYEQSLAVREKSLEAALRLAKQAVTNSPSFGFAWERLAELEFSFGRVDKATRAFEKSYALAPRNAEALALQGFLLAAENKTKEAIVWFNYAIGADSSLGNAWLGRGLCRIRRGDLLGGREDLLMAAALEPQRALLRSYLGKAYGEAGDDKRAVKELDRAKYLDPRDPTAWLYSALLDQQYNQINEAIRDLEHSKELNDNRSVYRSGLLLDQDQAVRSANLAAIYRDAGMFDVSVREASRAVNYDYANYSAHLFLAGSYQQLSDPKFINLRYETATEIEYLLANLLAPVGAGPLSQTISQQEYSKLFERNRLGLISSTEYSSHGDWEQSGAQYGTFGGNDLFAGGILSERKGLARE